MAVQDSTSWGRSTPSKKKVPALPADADKTADGGFGAFLRSAGRKSTDSLRSVKSAASRRSGKKGDFRSPSRASNGSVTPPVPTRNPAMYARPYKAEETEGNAEVRVGSLVNLRDLRANASAQSLSQRSQRRDDSGREGRTTPTQAQVRSASAARKARQPDFSTSASQLERVQEEQANRLRTSTAVGESERDGDGNTIAQLYAVFGLPKDPSVWTLAEEDCVAGVHHVDGAVARFWRPEVLGCSICPSPADVLAATRGAASEAKDAGGSKWEGRTADGKKPQNPKFIEMADGRGGVERAETARVLSKALKLSFTREIEIVAGPANMVPTATSHTFSFSVPTLSSALDATGNVKGRPGTALSGRGSVRGAVGEGYGLENRSGPGGSASTAGGEEGSVTFFGVVLTVWSAADERRAKTIRRELARATKGKNNAGRGKKGWEGDAQGEDEDGQSYLPANNTFFMPYAICIVSRFALYDLLGDWNKMAWHKYSRNIEMHNQLMATILRHPAPRMGETFRIDSPSNDISFYCLFPGAVEWQTGLTGVDFPMWPLFRTLSIDNILSVCEIALAPHGRVLFLSRHPALLGVAVETIKYIVELRGWRGVANQNCHARDVRIYLEDPGSWIIGINAELRSIVKPAPQVCVVDLDINRISCPSPPAGAPSAKGLRERRRRKLAAGVNISGGEHAPPREFIEAYPGGRFRPLSRMDAMEVNSAYEQLGVPVWWDQTSFVSAFDAALQDNPKSFFAKFKSKSSKAQAVNEAEMTAILALRRRASTFVDARDGLENKIGRLNKRLAFLMSESEMWKAQFSKIQQLVDRLTKEANELRGKLDRERRESRRLSSTLAQRDMERVQIQIQLKETEDARERAQGELMKMQRAMDAIESEREAMMDEIRNVISGGVSGDDDVVTSILRLDAYAETNNGSRPNSPMGSSRNSHQTPSQLAESILRHRNAAAERISGGRAGRTASRSGHSASSHRRSMSQDRGERLRAARSDASHSVHNFPDDMMNQEIQARTSVVTDQISRIQQQLESTLSNLEGRRSGTYERGKDREERRRERRLSTSSISSLRHEYGLPSSVGHGADNDSANGHGGGNGYVSSAAEELSDYEGVEQVKDVRNRRGPALNGVRNLAGPPPAASASSGGRLNASRSGNNLQNAAGKPMPQPRELTNPWKEAATKSKPLGVSTNGATASPAMASPGQLSPSTSYATTSPSSPVTLKDAGHYSPATAATSTTGSTGVWETQGEPEEKRPNGHDVVEASKGSAAAKPIPEPANPASDELSKVHHASPRPDASVAGSATDTDSATQDVETAQVEDDEAAFEDAE